MRQTFAGVLDRARKVERASLLERLSPDIGSEKLTAMLAIQLLEVICVGVKLSVRLYAVKHASSESVNTMLFIDTLKYAALGLRNALVIRWVVAAHRTGPNAQAFVPKNMFYDTTLGTQSEIALEVFAMFALGSVMQSMSFSQLVDGGTCSFVDPDHTSRALSSYYLNVNINDLSSEGLCVDQCVGVGTVFDVRAGAWPQGSVAPCDATVDFSVDKVVAQAAWAGAAYGGVATGIFVYFGQLIQFVNYITLVAVFAPLDNAHQGIKTLCQLMQVGMFVELVYDILLHIVYSTGDSQGLAGTKSAATSGSTSFHDLRIASLVAFITARLLAIRFFGFKAKHPRNVYCEQLHAEVPNLSGDVGASLMSGQGDEVGAGSSIAAATSSEAAPLTEA